MKQHQLNLITGSRPEVLERVLRVIRHRGYALCQLNMETLSVSLSIQYFSSHASNNDFDIIVALTP